MTFPKLEPITEQTLTHEHVERVRRAILGVPRKNALHRAILMDCAGVIAGNDACRETVVRAWNAMIAPDDAPVENSSMGAAIQNIKARGLGVQPRRSCCAACGEEGNARVCPACEHDHGDPAFEALQ